MIDYNRDFETMDFECDTCSIGATYEGDWQECVDAAKEDGWKIRKVDGDWKHTCSECDDD